MTNSQRRPTVNEYGTRAPRHGRPKTTIRFQLLMVVNSVLAVFVAFFLVLDYRRDLSERLEDKRIALEEEATTLLPAVLQRVDSGRDSVQQYIDTVCGRMQETHSPGHHIAVTLKSETFQAVAHHRASPEMLRAMQQAAKSPKHRAQFGESEIVVGVHERSGATVYVSETMENLYESVIGDILRRLAGFVGLALIAGVVVNLALSYIVTRPLKQLVDTVQRIGEGYLGSKTGTFRSAELDYLAAEINSMSESLGATETARKSEMARAREIQRNLLPNAVDLSGLNIAYLFEPADEVGGDFYDVLSLNDGTWLFCIADVTGHGVPAAMSAAMLKALLIQAEDQLTSPAAVLDYINAQMIAINPVGDFVSMAIVRVAPETGTVQYASAGHEPAFLLSSAGESQSLSSTGTLLGILEDAEWEDVTLELAPGHRVLIVTDGVSETRNEMGEMFGRQRVAQLFEDLGQLSVEQVTEEIRQQLESFRNGESQLDDVTVVLLELSTPKE